MRRYDYRPKKASGREVKEPTNGRLVTIRAKLRTEEGKDGYGRRNHTVERVFGIIHTIGRRFHRLVAESAAELALTPTVR